MREYEGTLTESDYASDPEKALLTVELPADRAEPFARRLADATGGKASVEQ